MVEEKGMGRLHGQGQWWWCDKVKEVRQSWCRRLEFSSGLQNGNQQPRGLIINLVWMSVSEFHHQRTTCLPTPSTSYISCQQVLS
jgi:hypothetical protein